MVNRYIKDKKETYIKKLVNTNTDKAYELANKDMYEPIFTGVEIHGESEITSDYVNDLFDYVKNDIEIIHTEITDTANDFSKLLEDTKIRLSEITTILNTEKQRQEDINMLCNKYTDYSNVLFVNNNNSTNDLNGNAGMFSLPIRTSKKVNANVLNVSGNGYEGNAFVYSNNDFIENSINSTNREYMVDNSILTYYEYSRITANNLEPKVFSLVNFDSINARCSILLSSDELFNTLELSSDYENVILESLSYSMDGQTFIQTELTDILINNAKARFDDRAYVYGSGVLEFKECYYVKVVLRAANNTNDEIAFVDNGVNSNNQLIKIPSAKRSVIRINNISLYRDIYKTSGNLKFDNFISSPADAISIFANEYCPDDIDLRQSIKYTLTVNGIDYQVIPINSNDNGKKVIRLTNKSIKADHVHYISETIKDASLTISLRTGKDYASPLLSNIKILIGGQQNV